MVSETFKNDNMKYIKKFKTFSCKLHEQFFDTNVFYYFEFKIVCNKCWKWVRQNNLFFTCVNKMSQKNTVQSFDKNRSKRVEA